MLSLIKYDIEAVHMNLAHIGLLTHTGKLRLSAVRTVGIGQVCFTDRQRKLEISHGS